MRLEYFYDGKLALRMEVTRYTRRLSTYKTKSRDGMTIQQLMQHASILTHEYYGYNNGNVDYDSDGTRVLGNPREKTFKI
jgi:hypothetical protein